MARVNSLELKEPSRTTAHAPVSASYVTFELDGDRFLQISTYGSAERQSAGVANQIMQFGPEGIAALRAVLAKLP